jgi:hypothetical protein
MNWFLAQTSEELIGHIRLTLRVALTENVARGASQDANGDFAAIGDEQAPYVGGLGGWGHLKE